MFRSVCKDQIPADYARGAGDFSPAGVLGVSPSFNKCPPKYGGLTGGLDNDSPMIGEQGVD